MMTDAELNAALERPEKKASSASPNMKITPDMYSRLGKGVVMNNPVLIPFFMPLLKHPKAIEKLLNMPGIQDVISGGQITAQSLANIVGSIAHKDFKVPKVVKNTVFGKVLAAIPAFEAGGLLAKGVPVIGGALKYGEEALSKIPIVGKTLSKLVGEGVSGAAGGALVDPKDAMQGAITGGVLGGTMGAVGQALPEMIRYASPDVLKERMLSYLSKGKRFQENAKAFAKNLVNSLGKRENEASALYNPFFKKVGNRFMPTSARFRSLMKQDKKLLRGRTKDLYDKFVEKPTIKNAHNLQSALYTNAKQAVHGPHEYANTLVSDSIHKMRNTLKEDIDNQLNKFDPTGDLKKTYQEASDYYKEHVSPYDENKFISKIARGKVTNPRNISNIFKSPEESTMKIVNDLGDEGKNRILLDEIDKTKRITPEKLHQKLGDLKNQGLDSYKTDKLDEYMEKIPRKIALKAGLQSVGGALTGAAGAAAFGGGIGTELIAGGTMGAVAPKLLKGLGGDILARNIAKAVGKAYPAIKTPIAATGTSYFSPEEQTTEAVSSPTPASSPYTMSDDELDKALIKGDK